MYHKICMAIVMFVMAGPALARYEVHQSTEFVEAETAREGRKKAIDAAIIEVSEQTIKQMIGEKRFNENKTTIEKNVYGAKNRFIPSFKISKTTKKDNGFEFEVEVKLSLADLRAILQQKGLFASSQRTGIIFPFIEVNDHINGESYQWWSPIQAAKMDLPRMSFDFEKEMVEGFIKKGLFLLRPQAFSMVHFVPDFLQKSFLSQTEKVQLAALKNAQLYLEGKVDIISSPLREEAYRIRIQIRCNQTGNGKNVAEIVRSFDTPPNQSLIQLHSAVVDMAKDSSRDLANQVYDLWRQGGLEAQVVKLAVTGQLNHMQMLKFKKMLSKSVAGIQSMSEHLFEPGRVTYEVNYRGGVEQLRNNLGKAKIDGFMSQIVASNAEEIIMDVKAMK